MATNQLCVKREVENPIAQNPREYDMVSRFKRSIKLADSNAVEEDGEGGYLVKSQNYVKNGKVYGVYCSKLGLWLCTCHDFAIYQRECKHVLACMLFRQRQLQKQMVISQ